MSENDSNIRINPNKPTELEFDVIISGIDDANIPTVRFVIVSAVGDCDYSFKCSKVSGEKTKWLAKMPAFPEIKVNTTHFCVEVVIDEYFFVPAKGEITFITTPEVQFKEKKTNKPSVTTSFTVKQEEDQPDTKKQDKKKTEEPITETPQGGGGGEITGMYAPTNALLTPEEDPTENGRMRGNTSVNDEFTDKDRLSLDKVNSIATSIQPGEGRAYQQEDEKESTDDELLPKEEEEFDPKKVADNIMKGTIGSVKKPTKKGSLFGRTSSGKPAIKGLEDAETKKQLESKASKVKEILGS